MFQFASACMLSAVDQSARTSALPGHDGAI
eukprot:COSAG01_NODE_50553_length_362_cov_0.984791_1_plen_29_part_01